MFPNPSPFPKSERNMSLLGRRGLIVIVIVVLMLPRHASFAFPANELLLLGQALQNAALSSSSPLDEIVFAAMNVLEYNTPTSATPLQQPALRMPAFALQTTKRRKYQLSPFVQHRFLSENNDNVNPDLSSSILWYQEEDDNMNDDDNNNFYVTKQNHKTNNEFQFWSFQQQPQQQQPYQDESSSSSYISYATTTASITLTKEEDELLQLIKKVRDRYCPSITLRIAGGWVRDKLLAGSSVPTAAAAAAAAAAADVDIDFVINNMSGSDFARLVQDYLDEQQNQTKAVSTTNENSSSTPSSSSSSSSNTATIPATPATPATPPSTTASTTRASTSAATTTTPTPTTTTNLQSDHLQTATIQIGNFSVDFCQLRFEKYTNRTSRIPTEIGRASIVEDAFRRDLTINALYYNLHTNQVEDWTEQGIQDLLVDRTISTPRKRTTLFTIMEDPLRILRAIRFTAQLSSTTSTTSTSNYYFTMDQSLKQAALDERVRQALRDKVSNDRIGKEINTIFTTSNPTRGIELLIETRLVDIIFPFITTNANEQEEEEVNEGIIPKPFLIYTSGFWSLFRTQTLVSRIFAQQDRTWDVTKRRYLWYAAFFQPFRDYDADTATEKQQQGGIRSNSKRIRRNQSMVHQLMSHRLRRPTSEIQSIEGIIHDADSLKGFLRRYDSKMVHSLLNNINDQQQQQQWNKKNTVIGDLRWMCYKVIKRIGPLWKESLLLALASSTQYKLMEAVQLYDDWIVLVEDKLQLKNLLVGLEGKNTPPKPLLNGSQIQNRALPGVRGESFRQIMKAQEEFQIRQGYFNNDLVTTSSFTSSSDSIINKKNKNDNINNNKNNSSEREQQESELINYLVDRFPQFR